MSSRLREVRTARGWSQERLVREIERYAHQCMAVVASTASLHVYISEWENGKRTISARYAAILRPVLGVTSSELLGNPASSALPASADGYEDLVSRIESARSIGVDVVNSLMDQTELLRTFDRQRGAASLVDQMAGHLATLEEALTFAVLPDARQPVARALAGAATLAAWQALDVGAVERAWRHYELAKRAAQEADEPMYLAHAMAEQAYVLCDAGRPTMGLELVRDAIRVGGGRTSPRLGAWLHAAEAELCAINGASEDCQRALEKAVALLPAGGEVRDPDMLSIFLNSGHLERWQGHSLALIGNEDAVNSLYAALHSADPTFVRAKSGLHIDLAQAHLAREEFGQANEHVQQARLLAGRTGSVRHRRRIDILTARM
ncbi:helix-turn-helix domain-containing protein [Streptomyces sp. NBC_01766]|uniref:helix-turn-helix domain-containing protein n=2 Tax=unclassified Streptomyces TaxID=2593676 RepID=UPI002DD80DCE|nr:helix-turn-helix transcriptional regulator [Streptomyces sp. NBC_01766]